MDSIKVKTEIAAPSAKAPTYLELITATPPKPKAPSPTPVPPVVAADPPKEKLILSKRERADQNWKILDAIITESEQFEKGSEERSKCLERLHQVLRTHVSKRPRTDSVLSPSKTRYDFNSATEEWDDFLAPSCEICGAFTDGACQCDQLAEHASLFLNPEEHIHREEDTLKSVCPSEPLAK